MNIILLSGGSGKRLWPLSNDIRSKQFVKFFKNNDGEYISMIQRYYAQLKEVNKDANITIATSKSQVSTIKNQLGDDVSISVEPCRRDTFPAIALACAYLMDVKGVAETEPVVIGPVDHYVGRPYFEALAKLSTITDGANLSLLGIEPTFPAEIYGYIIPKDKSSISAVSMFKEKPSADVAAEYIKQGALWNGGIFALKLGYMRKKTQEILGMCAYKDLLNNYENLTKISFDYAVAEKEPSIQVMRFLDQWKDIGTWDVLTEVVDDNVIGNGFVAENCSNVNVINELDIPVFAMGLQDAVVAASPDGILVSTKEVSSKIKSYVDKLEEPIHYAEKSWGSYKLIDEKENALVIKVTLYPGRGMHYHSHQHRDERWIITEGRGKVIVDGVDREVGVGDVVELPAGSKHTIISQNGLELIEIQIGEDISLKDKQTFTYKQYIWGTEDWIYQDEDILIKIIDAQKPLSVQVHPNDAYAAIHERGSRGKNEMWYILEAKPGAYVYCGVKESVSKDVLRTAAEDGTLENYLVKCDVKPGDVINIPAGTIHAIGGGCKILEVQQNSDITYRMYDYKRLDANGQPRQLHLDKAIDVAITEPSENVGTLPFATQFFLVEENDQEIVISWVVSSGAKKEYRYQK